MRRTWTTILLVTFTLLACAQTSPSYRDEEESMPAQSKAGEPQSGTIAIGCGYLLVQNHGRVHFTAFVGGNDMQQVRPGMPMFVIDDVLLEIETTTAAKIGVSDRGTDLLRSHLRWESDFISRMNHWPSLSPAVEVFDSGLPGVEALKWSFEPPAPQVIQGRRVARATYVTVAIEDVVLSIAAPLRSEDDSRAVEAKLEGIVRTIRRSAVPLDVGDLVKQFNDIHDPAKVCARWGGA